MILTVHALIHEGALLAVFDTEDAALTHVEVHGGDISKWGAPVWHEADAPSQAATDITRCEWYLATLLVAGTDTVSRLPTVWIVQRDGVPHTAHRTPIAAADAAAAHADAEILRAEVHQGEQMTRRRIEGYTAADTPIRTGDTVTLPDGRTGTVRPSSGYVTPGRLFIQVPGGDRDELHSEETLTLA